MRKLLMIGAAAALAMLGGRGMARRGSARQGVGSLLRAVLPVMLAPRWMRPMMLARVAARGRRIPVKR
jgi:hypothetical protein